MTWCLVNRDILSCAPAKAGQPALVGRVVSMLGKRDWPDERCAHREVPPFYLTAMSARLYDKAVLFSTMTSSGETLVATDVPLRGEASLINIKLSSR
jgi:hypothetical protein